MASSSRSAMYPIIDVDADDVVKNMTLISRSHIYPIIDVDAYDDVKNMASSSRSHMYPIIDVDAYDDVKNMTDRSRSDKYPIIDVDDENGIFPISVEKYAEEMQLQEALIFSASHKNESSPSQKDASSSTPEASSSQNKLKRKLSMVIDEAAAELPDMFCGICMDTKASSEMFSNTKVCGHLYCSDCIRQHISVKIKENIAKVKCPDPNCKGIIGPELCRSIVPKEVLERWEDALCESLILGTQKFYCPFKDCSAMLVDDGGEDVTSSECPNCNRLFCAQCKVAWHSGMDCNDYKSLKKDERNLEDINLMQLAKNNKWRRCPNCNFYVEKRSGCHFIKCRCGSHFCYGCGEIKCVCRDPAYQYHIDIMGRRR